MADQLRAVQTRAALVAAAAEVFARVGFERASLLQISTAAAVTKGALYYHFTSKEQLAQVVHDRARTAVREDVEALLRHARPGLRTAIDLTFALARRLELDSDTRAALKMAREPGREHESRDCLEVWQRALHAQLERAVAEGGLAPGTDTTALTVLALCMVLGPGGGSEEPRPPRSWLLRLWSVVLQGAAPALEEPRRAAALAHHATPPARPAAARVAGAFNSLDTGDFGHDRRPC